jgi:integrase
MKFKICKVKRKTKSVWVVQAMDNQGKKKNLQIFNLNQKRQAFAYVLELKNGDPDLVMPQEVSFKLAFEEYKKSVLKDKFKVEETKLHICGYIINHIQPYISKDLLSDYTYHDFKESYLPQLLASKCTRVQNLPGGISTIVRTNKTIGKKVVKDTVANFKLFVKYCLERKWVIDRGILDWKFNKNFFQGENTKKKFMPKYKDIVLLVNSEKDLLNRALFHTAAETGCRLNELLGLTYSDPDFKSNPPTISFNHTIDKWNGFRENFLKTASSKRRVEISKQLVLILKAWMKDQTMPTRAGQYRMIFGKVSKKMAKRKVQKAADKLGIKWEGGISPFRKFSYSYLKDTKALPKDQLLRRLGWTNSDTPDRWYYRDIDHNKDKRSKAINNLLS